MSMVDSIALYHGSTQAVRKPLVQLGRAELDFGPGFYVTNDREQAQSWARVKASRHHGALPCLNVYDFDMAGFNCQRFDRRIFKGYGIDWLDFVAGSRKGMQPWKGLDWIEGGIANDQVITTVDAYVDGLITAEQALGRLINAKLRHQVCIANQSIIDRYLRFTECIEL